MLHIPAFLFKAVLRPLQPAAFRHSPSPHIATIGSGPVYGGTAVIPKRIWTYWNHAQPDNVVQQCIQSWRHQCPGYEVILVHPDNLETYVPKEALPQQFDQLHPAKQADWLRLYLVSRHGGYWLDASTLLTRSLDWMPQNAAGASFTGFFLEKFTHDMRFPVIESWAFGAAAYSPFVTAWQQEFHHALIEAGTQTYLEKLRQRADWSALQQGIRDPQYLLIHIAAQKVLRDAMPEEQIALYKAEDSAYFYHARLRWKWYLLYPQLCLAPRPAAVSPIIKLRGGERRHFAEMQALHGGVKPDSLWAQALR